MNCNMNMQCVEVQKITKCGVKCPMAKEMKEIILKKESLV